MVLLASRVQGWKAALLIVKPDTLLHWHCAGFRRLEKWKSHAKARTPQIASETVTLITDMAANNRLWGAERNRGEVVKLGVHVADDPTLHAPSPCPTPIRPDLGQFPAHPCPRHLGLRLRPTP